MQDPLDETKLFQSRSAQRASLYICSAPNDEPAAARFCEIFESRGTPCWYSARDLTPEMAWPQCVVEASESSKFFVLILTDAASNSRDIIPEIVEAVGCARSIVVLQAIDRIYMPELEALLTNAHVIKLEDVVSDKDIDCLSDEDIDSAWNKIVEIELSSTWGDDPGDPGAVAELMASATANSFLIQLDCLRGSISGKTSCQLAVGDKLVFGRGSEADVFVDDDRASRQHAGLVLERDPKYGLDLQLIDLMSRNDTWLRYRREGDPDISKFLEHSQTSIDSGAIIRIGSIDIRVTAFPIPTNIVNVGSKPNV